MESTLAWKDQALKFLDQTLLPNQIKYLTTSDYRVVAEAIKRLAIRGAPAIGIGAAFGVVLGAQEYQAGLNFRAEVEKVIAELAATRPTAVNLFWALQEMRRVLDDSHEDSAEKVVQELTTAAVEMARNDVAINHQLGEHGAKLLSDKMGVLTHCNAGALATVAFGTALAVIRVAVAQGKQIQVYADETRPLLQGARLTAWELMRDGIPVTLITDNMAATVMRQGKVQAVIVGADRITANGDTANKIGTYGVAILAREHGIPFYVAAPLSTIDLSLKTGAEIPIEERAAEEVTTLGGVRIAPEGVAVYNPAFDVTPAKYIAGIITEKGVATGDWEAIFRVWKEQK